MSNLDDPPVNPGVNGRVVEPAEGPMPLEAVLFANELEKLDPAGAVYNGEVMLALGVMGIAEADDETIEVTPIEAGERWVEVIDAGLATLPIGAQR